MPPEPDPELPPELEQALHRGELSEADLRRLAAMRRTRPEAAGNRRLLHDERIWFWAFVILFAAGMFLGLPYYRDPHGHALLGRALGLEAGAGLVLMIRGGLLLWRPSGFETWRSPRIGGAAMVLIGLGLFGLGMSSITNVDGFNVLAVPALLALIGFLVLQFVRPRHSALLASIRRWRGPVTAVLMYVALLPFAAVCVAATVAAIGTVT